MNETIAIIAVLEFALEAAEKIDGLVTEQERKTLKERIARARAAIKDPIDTSADDAARRARLERALRGED